MSRLTLQRRTSMSEQRDTTRWALLAAVGAVGLGAMAIAPVGAQESSGPVTTGQHIPITIIINGKQELQLTGQPPMAGGFIWSVHSDNPSIAEAVVKPVKVGPVSAPYWHLTI